MDFIKYEGLGNDFIVLTDAAAAAREVTPEVARSLCLRGHRVGGDGVMWADPAVGDAHLTMRLLNSDGSTPEMCGNGIRCFVKYAVEVLGHRANPLRVATPGGVKACAWRGDDEGRVDYVTVDMGPPSFERARIPMTGVGPAIDVSVPVDGRTFVATGVNTGNPHMVIFGDASQETAVRWGPTLTVHPMWPLRANVEFAEQRSPTHLKVTVWERGCGLTRACGTGATAAVAAAVRAGMADFDVPVRVSLPGGDLHITIEAGFRTAWMEGPASEVFRGTISGPLAV